MADEFDEALEDSVRPEIDVSPEEILGIDDQDEGGEIEAHDSHDTDDDDADADAGGGDIDDDVVTDQRGDGGAISHAQQAQAQLTQAVDVERQWGDEHQRRTDAFKAAQEQFKAVRKKVMADEATDDEELAAQDAVFEARHDLDKSRDTLGEATRWREQVQSQPKLAPAQSAWLDANPKYGADPRFKSQAEKAMRELVDQGMDPTHQNFYRQVDEKLRKPTRMGRNSNRTPGAPAIRSTRDQGRTGSMTKAEKTFIRNLGRNPNDKAVAEQWAKSKANTKRIARNRGQL